MFTNDNFHEGSHQIAGNTTPLVLDKSTMNHQTFNLFICVVEKLNILFEVAVPRATVKEESKMRLSDNGGREMVDEKIV